ncbi:MAG: YdeI/OmpD-associated family protein, partial [Candidatus Aminicenantes bacterium]|nr:YdeI/OmpD-associated family protein [Candidatus Aminicenantes bacterium]
DVQLEIPPDLAAGVEADPQAKANFGHVSSSQKKMFAWWIISAKRPETRAQRILRCLDMIRTGEKFDINWRVGGGKESADKPPRG